MITSRITKFNIWETSDSELIGIAVRFGGGKSQTSTSQVSIPPEILAQYENVNSIANQVAQTPFTQYSTDPNAFVAPLTPTQQAGILGTNEYSNTAQPFYQTASNMNLASSAPVTQSQIQNYMNPYESAVINPTVAQMENQFNQAQSSQLGNAIQNGAFGGDRAAVSAANLQNQQALALGQTVGGLYNQNYAQALGETNTEQQAGLQGAMNEANLGSGAQAAGLAGAQAQLTAGQAQQQTEQAGETALYNQFLQQESYPFQTTQFLANIAEGTGALSGSTTTSTQPAPFFSDERLKDDIEPIGKTYDGLNIIKFRYKGQKQPHIGLSAQDVEKKHPEAVGLAGGYKTVDYDGATKEAADKGRHSHRGGLVHPDFGSISRHNLDTGGLVLPSMASRANFDIGGYAGLSPNSAWAAGFNLDPSYLQAQEAAYGNAPWGNAGPVSGATPYGGKSHVPPSTGSYHAALSVARPPSSQSSSGLQGLSQGIGQLEGLGKAGKSLFNDAKGYIPGLSPNTAASVGAPPPAQTQTQMPPDKAPPSSASSSPVAPASNDASAGPVAGLDVGTPDLSGLDDLGDVFAARGGLIHRDSGGSTPTFAQPTDDTSDDQSAGGDVPYDSGTGSGGLDIPDDKSNNHLAVAQPPSQSGGGGGGFNPLGLITGALGLFGLADGGRVGLAGGGNPDDVALPTLDDADSISQGLAPPDQAAALKAKAYPPNYWHAGGSSSGPIISDPSQNAPAMAQWKADTEAKAAANAPPARDIMVHKAAPAPQTAPTMGLNPDAPAPAAQPVQMVQDMGSGQHLTQPGEVLTQDNPGGVGDFLNRNQGLIVPLLHGLGTMASSNSRYLGSAILQGLGGAADSYENVQNEMQGRLGNQPIIQQRQNEALQTEMDAWQSYRAQVNPNLSFADFEKLKHNGQLSASASSSGRSAAPNAGPGDANGPFTFTPQEMKTRKLSNGLFAYQDPAYMSGYAANNVGVRSPYVQGTVNQANRVVGETSGTGFTTNAANERQPVPGFGPTALAQTQPAVQADQAKNFQDRGINFAQEYGRNMSLFDELGGIYQNFQAGPTADWRASVSRFANEFDPQGNFPFLHNIPAGNDAANYDKARKDIAQLTVGRLSELPGGAPRATMEELNQFAADPHLSPGALRDIIVRGKASLAQANDYYNGFDPFGNGSQGVAKYTNQFYRTNPYEKYRQQFEKATPEFAGQSATNSPGEIVPQAAPPMGTPHGARQAPDGNWYVPDPNRPGKYLRVD